MISETYKDFKSLSGSTKLVLIFALLILILILGLGIFDYKSNKESKRILLEKTKLEQKCREYGQYTGYDVELSESGICFIMMDKGISVPSDDAILINYALFKLKESRR